MPDALRARFLDEAPRAWADYLGWAARLSGTWSNDFFDLRVDPPVRLRSAAGVLKRRGRTGLLIESAHRPHAEGQREPEGEVRGANDRYAFELSRRGPDGRWRVRELKLLPPPNDPDYDRDDLRGEAARAVGGFGTGGYGLWLPAAVRRPGFAVLGARPGEDGVVRVEIDYPLDKTNQIHRTGWVEFDPAHDWQVIRYEFACGYANGGRNRIAGRHEYRPLAGRRVVTSHVTRIASADRTPAEEAESRMSYDLSDGGSADEAEFTLSAYGLPEPDGDPEAGLARSRLALDPADGELGEVPAGWYEVRYRVTNPTGGPVAVVGPPPGCGMRLTVPLPWAVPAGGSAVLTAELLVRDPGPFHYGFVAFAAEDRLRRLVLPVRGTVTRAERQG
ncbi:MAG: hypothetical protein K2X87_17995 [Gemmataceae bacterium]|nr:hypothetical protein [Gemmataceae bacterium]